jgi:hypothetical protein
MQISYKSVFMDVWLVLWISRAFAPLTGSRYSTLLPIETAASGYHLPSFWQERSRIARACSCYQRDTKIQDR